MVLHLDPSFKPITGNEINFEHFVFSGGEPHIRINPFDATQKVVITHRIRSFNDLGLLSIAVDALRRMGVSKIALFIPYFPAARQDRVMTPGESLTVKVIADWVNLLDVSSITILDPHSDVTPALLNQCRVISNHAFVAEVLQLIPNDIVLISPDAGASKKVFALAKAFQIPEVIECSKKRDVLTGQLSGFHVPTDDLDDKNCLIVDDICDGGGTFIGLGKELKKKNAGNLFLAVSHGIFSKGFANLTPIFHQVFTTDSFQTIDITTAPVIQIPIINWT